MPLEEHRYSVLLVSASETFNASLQSLFSEIGFLSAQTVSNISAAKRAVAERSYDFVIVNAPLPDDMGVRFAIDVCSAGTGVSQLLVRSEMHDEIRGNVGFVRHRFQVSWRGGALRHFKTQAGNASAPGAVRREIHVETMRPAVARQTEIRPMHTGFSLADPQQRADALAAGRKREACVFIG